MKILHVITNIDREASGPSYSVPALSSALNDIGCYSKIATTTSNDQSAHFRKNQIEKFPLDVFPNTASRLFQRSRKLRNYLKNSMEDFDVVHIHGLWQAPTVYPFQYKNPNTKFVLSPRGMLDPAALSISQFKKNLAWITYQRKTLSKVDQFHATSTAEKAQIRSLFPETEIFVAPNGISLPKWTKQESNVIKEKIFLYVGRVHPKKGLSILLDVWPEVSSSKPDWKLVICGPDEAGEFAKLQGQIQDGSLTNVAIIGPKYGKEKWQLYQRASVFVMPTLGENFGMTVAESLAVGTPCICTTGAPWQGLNEHGCGWWIKRDHNVFRDTMQAAASLNDEQINSMGKKGRSWMSRDYDWANIASLMLENYHG